MDVPTVTSPTLPARLLVTLATLASIVCTDAAHKQQLIIAKWQTNNKNSRTSPKPEQKPWDELSHTESQVTCQIIVEMISYLFFISSLSMFNIKFKKIFHLLIVFTFLPLPVITGLSSFSSIFSSDESQ